MIHLVNTQTYLKQYHVKPFSDRLSKEILAKQSVPVGPLQEDFVLWSRDKTGGITVNHMNLGA